jgi:hypothetical protein
LVFFIAFVSSSSLLNWLTLSLKSDTELLHATTATQISQASPLPRPKPLL